MREPRSDPPVRWWPLVAIAALTILGLVWVWGFAGEQRQDRVVATFSLGFAALLLFLLWLLALSRMRWSRRLVVFALLAAIGLVLVLGLERRGVTGDLVPVLGWRWGSASASVAAEPAGAGIAGASYRGDYPQFLGPDRDGTLVTPELADDWSAAPPRLLWRRPVGAGWSAFAVQGGFAVTQEQEGDDEIVRCYGREDGQVIWTHRDSVRHEDPLGGPGPRATPSIRDGVVYSLGGTGLLNALELSSGRLLWSVDVVQDAGSAVPEYGVSASPLLVDGAVVVMAGGRAERSLVAYDGESGEMLWSGGRHRAGYSSPLRATLGGADQVVVLNGSYLAGHDSSSGRLLWSHPWPDGTQNVSQPVVIADDRLFVSTGYGVGGKMFRVTGSGDGELRVETLWESRAMKAKLSNVVYRAGHLYGLDDGILACVDAETGKRVWKAGRYGHGQLILVGDLLLIQSEGGDVALVRATPDGHTRLSSFAALDGKTWNHPALAGNHLLVRNDREAACYELPLADDRDL